MEPRVVTSYKKYVPYKMNLETANRTLILLITYIGYPCLDREKRLHGASR